MNWPFQQALFLTLSGASDLMSLIDAVYDHVPQADRPEDDAKFPFVTIGEVQLNEFDTDDVLGFEAMTTVHVWSRSRGRREVKEVQDVIYDILHRAELAIAGARFVSCDQQYAESFVEPDGLTRHGVQRFRVLFDRA